MGRYYYRFAGDPRYYAYNWQGIPPESVRAAETKQLGEYDVADNYGPGLRYPPLTDVSKKLCPPQRAVCVPQLGDCYTSPPIGEGEKHIHDVMCTPTGDAGAATGKLLPFAMLGGVAYLLYKYKK